MKHQASRRKALVQGCAVAALPLLPLRSFAQERRFEPKPNDWRTFEVTTTVTVAEPQGTVRVWLPAPDFDTAWQRTRDHAWSGNAGTVKMVSDVGSDTRMLYAEFGPEVKQPTVQLVTRVQTRNRVVDWIRPAAAREDAAVLREALAPTELLPLDGIVKKTALEASKGAKTDVEKTRALYEWVIANAHREPKVRGCGTGDIKTMLETGNLGGKCADLNALFVGMCRSVGIPARDVYGLRLVPSAFGYKELSGNPANLKGAQHCRAEVFLRQHGWVAMDPADVLKVMRQETADWIRDPKHPVVAPVYRGLFGSWEGNWLAYNDSHDVKLPASAGKGTLPFLMYPNGENASGRFDELAPDSFKYTIVAREITA